MIIRKAQHDDIPSVAEIYEKIHDLEENGSLSVGWIRNVYPTLRTAEDALLRDDLFVADNDGKIVGSAIFNNCQGDMYKHGKWTTHCDDKEIMVMHTLTIDPEFFGNGLGKEFVKFYENHAVSCGCKCLRIDTQEKNKTARTMYKKCGFTEVGTVSCIFNGIPDVRLVLIEKNLY